MALLEKIHSEKRHLLGKMLKRSHFIVCLFWSCAFFFNGSVIPVISFRKELIAKNLLWRDKIKKVLSRAHECSLVQRAKNAYDQNEQTLHPYFIVSHRMV